ncbi:uncharacterized protein LOC129599729 [Paramacrobiotus metropolitanus]|uniref:uncharacterized protein LOC129599729 n=1 Tax=Paramacrobiotus metropolitanus TaxID=2943436 RepID=UPI002445833E|nr:uncharacterized protein LOC129599729 [Paramacrobiotus metropolitanus]
MEVTFVIAVLLALSATTLGQLAGVGTAGNAVVQNGSRATPVVDAAWTDQSGTLRSDTQQFVNTACNAYTAAQQSSIAASLLTSLAGRFTRHNWSAIVGTPNNFGFQTNYAVGSRFKAACNGNDYYIWGNAK